MPGSDCNAETSPPKGVALPKQRNSRAATFHRKSLIAKTGPVATCSRGRARSGKCALSPTDREQSPARRCDSCEPTAENKPTTIRPTNRAESRLCQPRQPSRSHPFLYERFHVLLNSLFKVLCNFPSRYLLAIGLAAVFDIVLEGVYLPLRAALSSNPTLGETAVLAEPTRLPEWEPIASYGTFILYGIRPRSKRLERDRRQNRAFSLTSHCSDATTSGAGAELRRWTRSLSLAVTREILVSFFSTA